MPGVTRARILYYIPCLYVGGSEKKVHDLAASLADDRFDPVVAWSCFSGSLVDSLISAGIPVLHLPLNRPKQLADVVTAIHQIRPDIFHSFSYRKDDLDVRAALEAGVPTILTSRGDIRFWDDAQTVQNWELFRNQGTHRITVCSQAIAAVVRHVEKVAQTKIRVIYNGVNLPASAAPSTTIRQELGIAVDDPLIGYVANYRQEKGHETLLRAFARVLSVYPSAHLICCGASHPGVKTHLESLAAEIGISEQVHLLDLQLELERIYRGLDIYVHPSDTEGFSNALLEGMAYGKPVVATRTGGNIEAVCDGETGLLVPPRDPASLAAAVVAILKRPKLAVRLGNAARQKIRASFQFQHMLDGYRKLYEEELEKQ